MDDIMVNFMLNRLLDVLVDRLMSDLMVNWLLDVLIGRLVDELMDWFSKRLMVRLYIDVVCIMILVNWLLRRRNYLPRLVVMGVERVWISRHRHFMIVSDFWCIEANIFMSVFDVEFMMVMSFHGCMFKKIMMILHVGIRI